MFEISEAFHSSSKLTHAQQDHQQHHTLHAGDSLGLILSGPEQREWHASGGFQANHHPRPLTPELPSGLPAVAIPAGCLQPNATLATLVPISGGSEVR